MPYAILIGPPGSGKSRVGRALANTLGVGFIDSDSVVEKNRVERFQIFSWMMVKQCLEI